MLWLALTLCAAPPDVEAQIERGQALILDTREEKALALLEPIAADAAVAPMLRGRAAVYAGVARLNLGDEAKARALFVAALEADPGATPPDWASRRVRALFDRALAELTAQQVAKPLAPVVVAPAPAPAPAPASPAVVPEAVAPAPSRALPVGLGIAAAACLVASAVQLVLWNDAWRSAEAQGRAVPANALLQRSKALWYGGFITGGVALGLGAFALVTVVARF